jgi:hypothetical protein
MHTELGELAMNFVRNYIPCFQFVSTVGDSFDRYMFMTFKCLSRTCIVNNDAVHYSCAHTKAAISE